MIIKTRDWLLRVWHSWWWLVIKLKQFTWNQSKMHLLVNDLQTTFPSKWDNYCFHSFLRLLERKILGKEDFSENMMVTQLGWASRALTWEKDKWVLLLFPLLPLLSKVYQNQWEFGSLNLVQCSESWWFGTWCVAYEGQKLAGKVMMFVINGLVITQQGKCWFWKGKQTEELNF